MSDLNKKISLSSSQRVILWVGVFFFVCLRVPLASAYHEGLSSGVSLAQVVGEVNTRALKSRLAEILRECGGREPEFNQLRRDEFQIFCADADDRSLIEGRLEECVTRLQRNESLSFSAIRNAIVASPHFTSAGTPDAGGPSQPSMGASSSLSSDLYAVFEQSSTPPVIPEEEAQQGLGGPLEGPVSYHTGLDGRVSLSQVVGEVNTRALKSRLLDLLRECGGREPEFNDRRYEAFVAFCQQADSRLFTTRSRFGDCMDSLHSKAEFSFIALSRESYVAQQGAAHSSCSVHSTSNPGLEQQSDLSPLRQLEVNRLVLSILNVRPDLTSFRETLLQTQPDVLNMMLEQLERDHDARQ
jgi:hypothetical protein